MITREEFPVLGECVYLNSNSMGATPRGARVAANRYFDVVEHWRDEVFEDLFAEVRGYTTELGALLAPSSASGSGGGGAASSIALDVNVSTLLGRLLSCFDWKKRPRAITTDLEFPSVEFLLDAFRRYGCEPVVVTSKSSTAPPAGIDVESVCAAIDEQTQIVIVSHATFTTGALTNVAPIVARARDVGALVALDAYQTIGVLPVDVDQLGVDVVFGGSHKWLCGAFDLAFAWVRPSLITQLEPAATGWMASSDPMTFAQARGWAPDARRLASGTPALLPAITSREGLQIVGRIGVERIREISLFLTDRILAQADDEHIEVVTPRRSAERGGIVALRVPHGDKVTTSLKQGGFICSHRDGNIRIAPHFYNTSAEVDIFMDALVRTCRDQRDAK